MKSTANPYKGYGTRFARYLDEFAQNSVVCMAPVKLFNLAGLHASVLISIKCGISAAWPLSSPVPMSSASSLWKVAFRDGDDWLAQCWDTSTATLK